jgi:hypothetical protein
LDSAFRHPFLFARMPGGNIETICDQARSAGFHTIFFNVGGEVGYDPDKWSVCIDRAVRGDLRYGPWVRTQNEEHEFDPALVDYVRETAYDWNGPPYIVNSEAEIKGSGAECTGYIAQTINEDDAAVSVEARPFTDVHWYPLAHIPVLPQIFPESGLTSVDVVKREWWAWGVNCVFPTFASYGGRRPTDYDLNAPYSVYTADDIGPHLTHLWSPTSYTYEGCQRVPIPPDPPKPQPEVKVAGVKTEVERAWVAFDESSVPQSWRRDNPGEYNAIKAYYTSATAPDPSANVKSKFGIGLLALVNAGKWGDGTHA